MSLSKKLNGNGNGRKAATSAEINPRVLDAIESEIGRELAQAILKMTGTRLNNRTAVLVYNNAFQYCQSAV